jgi:hypothetical protein
MLSGHITSVAKQYREFAHQCFSWAKTANTEHEREIFLEIATAWMEAARCAEAARRATRERRPWRASPGTNDGLTTRMAHSECRSGKTNDL